MVISYVVRLRPDALADGRFVGEIEAVTSRRRTSVRSIDQMAAFILATMPGQVSAASEARQVAIDEPVTENSTELADGGAR
jgi:hypothetical protein